MSRILALVALLGWPGLPPGQLARPTLDEEAVEAHLETMRGNAREWFRERQARLIELGYRIEVGGVALCREEVGAALGAAIGRRHDFLYGFEEEAAAAFGAIDEVKVFHVIADSPAARAGIEVGDLIEAVDGGDIDKTEEVFAALRTQAPQAHTFGVRRGEARLDLRLPYVPACHHGLFVRVASSPLPGGRGREDIWTATGVADFAQSEDEMAIAISHQLAHHVLDTWRPHHPKEEKPAADRLGLFLAARAGFDVSNAAAFWDRLAAEQPWRILADPGPVGAAAAPHVALPARMAGIHETVEEILALREAEEPLLP